jgi:glycosyltransferase involved in cell wall biosynthesis
MWDGSEPMGERPRTWQQAERRALVADLIRTQGTLQARSEQLQEILGSRWHRLARSAWRARRRRPPLVAMLLAATAIATAALAIVLAADTGALIAGLLGAAILAAFAVAWAIVVPALRDTSVPRMAGEESIAVQINEGAAMGAAEPEAEEEPEAHRASAPDPVNGAAVDLEPRREPMPGLEMPRGSGGRERTRLLLAGHSLSFCEGIARRARQGGAAVREDLWRTHGAHDEEASAAALAWADVVHCEWCLGNAAWYSRNKLPGQRLVVRFHRMELDTPYPGEVDLEQVDAMVFVARHVLERACERWGWDADDSRFLLVPNGIDRGSLGQEKLPGARFTLAAIGYVPRLKRLDRALDVLELLRRRDERYRLLVKGREPWEYSWMAGREEERRYYEELFERLELAPGLRGAVDFEPFDDDIPAFLRQTGWILSTSEVEGHSVALAEGMASGAIPAILERPGAEQYEERWVHADPGAAAEAILATEERGETAAEGEAARRFAERWSWERLGPEWDRLLQGSRSAVSA